MERGCPSRSMFDVFKGVHFKVSVSGQMKPLRVRHPRSEGDVETHRSMVKTTWMERGCPSRIMFDVFRSSQFKPNVSCLAKLLRVADPRSEGAVGTHLSMVKTAWRERGCPSRSMFAFFRGLQFKVNASGPMKLLRVRHPRSEGDVGTHRSMVKTTWMERGCSSRSLFDVFKRPPFKVNASGPTKLLRVRHPRSEGDVRTRRSMVKTAWMERGCPSRSLFAFFRGLQFKVNASGQMKPLRVRHPRSEGDVGTHRSMANITWMERGCPSRSMFDVFKGVHFKVSASGQIKLLRVRHPRSEGCIGTRPTNWRF